MNDKYAIVIFYSEEDECWVADIPDLKFCTAFGDTQEEALQEVLQAKESWLQVAKEDGIELPAPSFSIPLYTTHNSNVVTKSFELSSLRKNSYTYQATSRNKNFPISPYSILQGKNTSDFHITMDISSNINKALTTKTFTVCG